MIENIQRRATKFILNYPPREVSYINRLDQLNLLPLDFRRQMHDLVLLFKYKTGTLTSNFGRFIHTATQQYRTRNFHQANFDLLSRHNQEYYCNSCFPTAYLIYSSLARISCGLESIFTNTLEVYYKLTVCHDLSIIFQSYYVNLILFFEQRGYLAIGAPPCSSLRSRHTTVMIMYVFCGDKSQ